MKHKIVKFLISASLFLFMAVSPQILGINSQNVSAKPGKNRSGGSSQEVKVKVDEKYAKRHIDKKTGELKFAQGTTQVNISAGALSGNTAIKSIVFPDSVTKISFGMTSLAQSSIETIVFPKNLRTLDMEIGCFYRTRNLKTFNLSKTQIKNVDFAENGFFESNIENLLLPEGLQHISFGKTSFLNTKSLKSPLVFNNVSTVKFAEGSFYESGIPQLVFMGPSEKINFGLRSFVASKIVSINLPEISDEVEFGEHSFSETKDLVEPLNLGKTNKVIFGVASFSGSAIPGINYNGPVGKMNFGKAAFCLSAIRNIQMPPEVELNMDTLAFTSTAMETADFSNVKLIKGTFSLPDQAFAQSYIEKIILPNAKNINFGPRSFAFTVGLKHLIIPKSAKNTCFGEQSFHLSSIQHIEFLDQDDNIQSEEEDLIGIPNGSSIVFECAAFANDSDLSKITFPKNLHSLSIGPSAFRIQNIVEGNVGSDPAIVYPFPGQLTVFDLSQTNISDLLIDEFAFMGSSIKDFHLPKSLQKLTVGKCSFAVSKITALDIPTNSELKCLTVKEMAFAHSPLSEFNLSPYTFLAKFSCDKAAFFNSNVRDIILPINDTLAVDLKEKVFSHSKIENLDFSHVRKLRMKENVFSDSCVKNISLPHILKIKCKGKSPGLPIPAFLGCGKDTEIIEQADFSAQVLFPELEQEEEDMVETAGSHNNVDKTQGFNLNQDELVQILMRKYPLYAKKINNSKNSSSQQSWQEKQYNVTSRQMSRERATKIARNIIFLNGKGWPTKGDVLDDITHKVYEKRGGNVLEVSGHEYHSDTFALDEHENVFRTPLAQQGGRIIKTKYAVFFKEHHVIYPNSVLALSGKYKGKMRILVEDTQGTFKWVNPLPDNA